MGGFAYDEILENRITDPQRSGQNHIKCCYSRAPEIIRRADIVNDTTSALQQFYTLKLRKTNKIRQQILSRSAMIIDHDPNKI